MVEKVGVGCKSGLSEKWGCMTQVPPPPVPAPMVITVTFFLNSICLHGPKSLSLCATLPCVVSMDVDLSLTLMWVLHCVVSEHVAYRLLSDKLTWPVKASVSSIRPCFSLMSYCQLRSHINLYGRISLLSPNLC